MFITGCSGTPPFRNPRQTDWEAYRKTLAFSLQGISASKRIGNHYELEDSVTLLNGAILDAFNCSFPEKQRGREKDAIWRNSHLSALRTALRKLGNRTKRNGHRQEYKVKLTEYNKEIRKGKQNSFRNFCEGIESLPEATRVYKALAKNGSGVIMSLRREDGSYTNSEIERAELLLRTHFPGSRVGNSGQPYSKPVNSGNESRQTASQLKWALTPFYRSSLRERMESFLPYYRGP